VRDDKPSRTAIDLAWYLAYNTRDPELRPLYPAGAGESTLALLRHAIPTFDRDHARWESRGARWRIALMERWGMPGMALYHIVRKRYVDDEVARAVRRGARQLVVLGAGLDTLALRVAGRHPAVTCIEIDHPATQSLKRRGVEGLGAPANLHLLPADLATVSLREVLGRCEGFDADAPTVFVAEGLLMYLPPGEVRALFDFVRRNSDRSSRFVFSYIRAKENGVPYIGRLDALARLKLKHIGEPFRWGIPLNRLAGFVRDCGLELIDAPAPADLRQRYLVPEGLAGRKMAAFEFLAVAELR